MRYRIWDKNYNKYLQGILVLLPNGDVVIYKSGTIVKNVIVEMSTGLKDCNGVEIYEGDKYYYQAYNPLTGIFSEHENVIEDYIFDTMELMQLLDSDYISDLGVIGNIHE